MHTAPWPEPSSVLTPGTSPPCLPSLHSMLCAMRWGVFLFFAGWVVVMTLFTLFLIPGKLRL